MQLALPVAGRLWPCDTQAAHSWPTRGCKWSGVSRVPGVREHTGRERQQVTRAPSGSPSLCATFTAPVRHAETTPAPSPLLDSHSLCAHFSLCLSLPTWEPGL